MLRFVTSVGFMCALALLLSLAACGDAAAPGTDDPKDTQSTTGSDLDGPGELPIPKPDTKPPADGDNIEEIAEEELCPLCGTPCESNDECDDGVHQGWCVQVDAGGNKECTVGCVSECPPDYGCVAIQNTGTDVLFVCMPKSSVACNVCANDADCLHDNSKCLAIGASNGSPDMRCAPSCESNADCKSNYVCEAMGGVDNFCVPVTGSCICRGKYADGSDINGSNRECIAKNTHGICSGVESCEGDQGWIGCTAKEPLAEICDGEDNNCSGEPDEGLVSEPCTTKNAFGECSGTSSCAGVDGWICNAAVPEAEICDTVDNNCDGKNNEGFPNMDSDDAADCVDDDIDGDGVLNDKDNCPTIVNPDQKNSDDDGLGDACDSDIDGDGVPDASDNCPKIKNAGQGNMDNDGLGDVCDDDIDGDGDPNESDCKPTDKSIHHGAKEICNGLDDDCNFQIDDGFPDSDSDGNADCIDDDDDNDGIPDAQDNCVTAANAKQEDLDGDGQGDACDNDKDGDGQTCVTVGNCLDCDDTNDQVKTGLKESCDGIDNNCNNVIDEGFLDTDDDDLADCIDDDDDNDTVKDFQDNCQFKKNKNQKDSDGDGIGDACDDDVDGDGVPDATDNCPQIKNAGQENFDGDENGDLCDLDDDNDGSPDTKDCEKFNPDIYPNAKEVCDGVDNNCKFGVDEGLGSTTCGKGSCLHTVQNCQFGVLQNCDPFEGQAAESCDGKDNNCNGLIDEGLGQSSCGKGVCLHTINNCVGGNTQVCDPFLGKGAEVCDLKDNDCDGKIDEGFGQKTCGKGVCEHTVNVCDNGAAQICDPFQGKGKEFCDGKDNDCNGLTDDELFKSCYTGPIETMSIGVCQPGQSTCAGGLWGSCVGDVLPLVELCNQQDDDCDGTADEGFTIQCQDLTCTGTGLIHTISDGCMDDGGGSAGGDSLQVYCCEGSARFCLSGESCPWKSGCANTEQTCSTGGLSNDYMASASCQKYKGHSWYGCTSDGNVYFQ